MIGIGMAALLGAVLLIERPPGRNTHEAPARPSAALARRDGAQLRPRTACAYSAEHISALVELGSLLDTKFTCAMVFNDAAPTWKAWERPWFLGPGYADEVWSSWTTAPRTYRHLVITQNLFPDSERRRAWLRLGASGAFDRSARALATNLVKAGLGWSIIRLAPEANGTWEADSIPDTLAGDEAWVRFWRATAITMRSVPGAHFLFDWTVNARYRNVPLEDFYPGDDVVNVIGVDSYDSGTKAGPDRWQRVYHEPDGLAVVASFARRHHKYFSIPEWGIGPRELSREGWSGDDPAYVNGIAWVVRHQNALYQSYFDASVIGLQLAHSPQSIAAYKRHFGGRGDSVSTPPAGGSTSPALPWVRLLRGPAYGSTVKSSSVRLEFSYTPWDTPVCRLDNRTAGPCSSANEDLLTGLHTGFHFWTVTVSNRLGQQAVAGTAFVATSE